MKKLDELLKEMKDVDAAGAEAVAIEKLVYDSRSIVPGCLFIAIRGANFDAHSAIVQAAEAGAAAVLAEEVSDTQRAACEAAGTRLIITKDTRLALALCSAAWFDYPARRLCTIGITGTKGKTSVSFMCKTALDALGVKCGLIGTVCVDNGKEKLPAKNTTPESYELQEYLAQMADAGCKAVVMEVSSQGLMMHRTAGICFDVAVFTNLSPDHIGPNEHKDFADYLYCKSLLFKQAKAACVNADDEHTEEILKGNSAERILRFGFSEAAELRAADEELYTESGRPGVAFGLSAAGLSHKVLRLPFPGHFSVYNALASFAAVLCAAERLKINAGSEDFFDTVIKGFHDTVVPGRCELLPVSKDYSLMIDYAHNAVALESLLNSLKEYPHGRIITLFGCGGNRARDRRFSMGEVSGRLSDVSVITSDNPRNEDPMAIIEDILSGIKKTDGEYVTIPDRKEAIAWCMENAKEGDIVVLAGKGHEDYQEIKGVKYPMDERKLVLEILTERGDDAAVAAMRSRYPEL